MNSGAADSVMPKGILLNEPMIDRQATRDRVECVAQMAPARRTSGEEDQVQEIWRPGADQRRFPGDGCWQPLGR